ncbi:MAG: peptidase S58 [candidate division NC10 bacterium RIFCSPLOWO2_12_FULL_66_18]|nr:MAG: peptidase S58 [candidate division NC10 bacterium RIFCSPLOWO2_02_FULL_66_22]OGC00527.1 MAG: peptidase S58 [candidate division NC10 bacterium RIFCSPLOWO2_12_FULL_66_18]
MLTAIPGIRVGHATDAKGCTGCTVVLCPEGTVGGADVRGSAAGTRELDALSPLHLVPHVHGVLLAGGSAFGLDAAAGVMQYLEERGIGFDVQVTRVPIVPTAILFDLRLGDARARPDPRMAYAACQQASTGLIPEGSVGAGTGATVGKLFGITQAMKSGLGTAGVTLPGGVMVAALAVVNAFGDVRDPLTGQLLAGARETPESRRLVDTAAAMRAGVVRRGYDAENTTLAVVATNARLTKVQATKMAQMAHQGMVRTIAPVHTTLDGDLAIALATGEIEADLNAVGLAAADSVAEAILRAVKTATALGGLPAWADLQGPPSR